MYNWRYFFSDLDTFWNGVPKRWILWLSSVLGLVVGFGIRIVLGLRRSMEAVEEEDNGRIWIEYYVFFIFFHV
jgi:hypothetical protein